MDYQTLWEWIEVKPFEPFRMVMTDGRSIEVRNPRLIWPARNNVFVGLPENPAEPDIPSRHATVSMLHIVRLEPLDSDASVGPG